LKAQRIHEWGGPLKFEEVTDPVPADDEVLIQVEACGVGLTVLNYMGGDLGSEPNLLPRIPGHEVVGRIVAAGSGVDRARIGERIIAFFYLFCGRCRRCIAGEESMCESLAGFLGVHRDGGYAPLLTLPDRNAVSCPDQIAPAEATVVPDAVATPVHVVRRTKVTVGSRVAVIGAGGGVGIHMVQVAKLYGAQVVGLDVAGSKLAFLQDELKISAIDSTDVNRISLPGWWRGGVDVVVDLVGSRETTGWGVAVLASAGRLALLTTFRDVSFSASQRDMVLKQTSIVGCRYASRFELALAGDYIASGAVRPVIGAMARLSEVATLHEQLRAGSLLGRAAVLPDRWPKQE
jgi:propanol-preferring alcohol dehydrogenase